MDVLAVYEKLVLSKGIPFDRISSPAAYDDTTLFCPAGMQKYKQRFLDETVTGESCANVQTCLRVNDLEEVGDGTHSIVFNMLGFFSFRHMTVPQVVEIFLEFVSLLGITLEHVTVHADKFEEWKTFYPQDLKVLIDPECMWSDGKVGGYCTEFYTRNSKNELVEIGNIVNPLGTCIDVGFGLDRLEAIVNGVSYTRQEELQKACNTLLLDGFVPSNTKQGYVLRKLLRLLDKEGGVVDSPHFFAEQKKRKEAIERYHKLKDKHSDKTPEWWKDTHGVDISLL